MLHQQLTQGMSALSVNGKSSGQQTDGNIVVREGVLFQVKKSSHALQTWIHFLIADARTLYW